MLTNDLLEQISFLSPEDKEELIKLLLRQECEDKNKLSYASFCIRVTERIIGESIVNSSRKSVCVWGRAIVAYILRKEKNFTTVEIGKLLKRNHSTVIFLINRVEFVLNKPVMYKDVCVLYKKVKEYIDKNYILVSSSDYEN